MPDMTFPEWLLALNAAAVKRGYTGGERFFQGTGEDCWRESYDTGMSPEEALIEDETYA